jgi:hypothetical protein
MNLPKSKLAKAIIGTIGGGIVVGWIVFAMELATR